MINRSKPWLLILLLVLQIQQNLMRNVTRRFFVMRGRGYLRSDGLGSQQGLIPLWLEHEKR